MSLGSHSYSNHHTGFSACSCRQLQVTMKNFFINSLPFLLFFPLFFHHLSLSPLSLLSFTLHVYVFVVCTLLICVMCLEAKVDVGSLHSFLFTEAGSSAEPGACPFWLLQLASLLRIPSLLHTSALPLCEFWKSKPCSSCLCALFIEPFPRASSLLVYILQSSTALACGSRPLLYFRVPKVIGECQKHCWGGGITAINKCPSNLDSKLQKPVSLSYNLLFL